MTPHLAYGLLTGLAFLDLLALIVIGRGRLERRREAQCRILAQDLTAKVRERCEAYRRLEQRIAGVIDDFDRHEAFSLGGAGEPLAPTAGHPGRENRVRPLNSGFGRAVRGPAEGGV